MKSINRKSKGFSLLEVLISISVLVLLAVAFYETSMGSLKRALILKTEVKSAIFAKSLMEEWKIKRPLIAGTYEGSDNQFNWTVTVSETPFQMSETSRKLNLITVSVMLEHSAMEFQTLTYR